MNFQIGAHQSISGGIEKSLERANELNTKILQIFTKNSNRWKGKEIPSDNIKKFFFNKKIFNISEVYAHAAYLINLASPDPEIIKKSIDCLKEDIENCLKLQIKYIVLHPGSHKGRGEDFGITQVAKNLDSILKNFENEPIKILLETTAGQGDCIGHRLEHLKMIKEKSDLKNYIAFCLDTCHLFAAGYDFRNKNSFEKLKQLLDKNLGLDNIFLIHLNDSKKELGSRIDRHEHIGKGKIGLNGFSFFLNDEDLSKKDFIIETPKGNNMDFINIKTLKSLKKE